jgi:hypothetical protein
LNEVRADDVAGDHPLLDASENPVMIPRAPKRQTCQWGSMFQCRFHEYKHWCKIPVDCSMK